MCIKIYSMQNSDVSTRCIPELHKKLCDHACFDIHCPNRGLICSNCIGYHNHHGNPISLKKMSENFPKILKGLKDLSQTTKKEIEKILQEITASLALYIYPIYFFSM